MRAPLLIMAAWLAAAPALAQAPPPRLTNTVNDFARVIDASSRAELDRRIRALREATGDTLVVATVPTYKPDYGDINEYAVKMFENGGHGIGDKGKDNGILLVVAVQDRQVRIEVGYDLEQFIPDGFAGETIRQAITPEFRQGHYGAGLLAGATRIINRIADERHVTIPDVPNQPVSHPVQVQHFPFGVLIFIGFALLSVIRRASGGRPRYWGIGPWSGWGGGVGGFGGGGFGGGGGGFGGFGGGGSGGGGASGGW